MEIHVIAIIILLAVCVTELAAIICLMDRNNLTPKH